MLPVNEFLDGLDYLLVSDDSPGAFWSPTLYASSTMKKAERLAVKRNEVWAILQRGTGRGECSDLLQPTT